MPKKKGSRGAQGAGTIRQRKDGKWEARYTAGRDPGTGKQVQKSVYGATQKEVLKKLQQVQNDIENGTYVEPVKMTVGSWMDTWLAEYTGNISRSTYDAYEGYVRNHIKPNLGAVLLQNLKPPQVQGFYNGLTKAGKSPKTVKNIHGAFHEALEQAVLVGYLKTNPTSPCILPKRIDPEIKVMSDEVVVEFLRAIDGHQFETIFFVDLFTGMRQGEILGLPWKNVNFDNGTILIDQQLLYTKKPPREYYLGMPKHDKVRTIAPAEVVMQELRQHKARQAQQQLVAGSAWNNPWDLVFTNQLGQHLTHNTVYKNFKIIAESLGEPDLTFHGMRHAFVVLSLANGDDIKSIQANVGHHAASFMLDRYGHVIDSMRKASSERMNNYIKGIQQA